MKKCLDCGKIKSYYGKYCKKCGYLHRKHVGMKGKKHSEKSKKKMSDAQKGKVLSEETRTKMRISQLGHEVSASTRKKIGKGNSLSLKRYYARHPEAKKRISLFSLGRVPWNKGKPYLEIRGENHWQWKGGVTNENLKIRTSIEYKLWRRSVFERDNHTCTICGDNSGGNLEADHIKQFAYFPELRFDIDNGRTLCKTCHKNTDNWGWKGKKNDSFI